MKVQKKRKEKNIAEFLVGIRMAQSKELQVEGEQTIYFFQHFVYLDIARFDFSVVECMR